MKTQGLVLTQKCKAVVRFCTPLAQALCICVDNKLLLIVSYYYSIMCFSIIILYSILR